jgi:hypothetical protein
MKMDYGRLLRRAWEIIWQHKFLILLGVLVALSGVSNTSSSGYRFDRQDFSFDRPFPRDFEDLPQFEIPQAPELPGLPRNLGLPIAVGGALLLIIVGIAIVVGLGLWAVSTLARGGLIAGVNAIEGGGASSFGDAFRAGWQNGWRLLGIGLLPAIPGLILFIAGLGLSGVLLAGSQLLGARTLLPAGIGIISIFGMLACIALPFALVLGLIRNFAERACMLEDLGVFAAYRRAWQVLTGNLGEAILLFLIQIGISIALGLLMAMPGLLMALCCVLWPILLALRGAIAAYFSTLWTLAWREWALPVTEAV